jgi:hypothetical protein
VSAEQEVTGFHTELAAHNSFTECNIGTTQKFSSGVSATIELKKYTSYIRQYRQTSQLKHTPLDTVIVRWSRNIFELNRSINSKWGDFGFCHYCIQ